MAYFTTIEDRIDFETRYWPHYKDVAKKHYEVLKLMYITLKQPCNDASSLVSKLNLLYDAYYISGYIFEAAAVYAIFKKAKWKRNDSVTIDMRRDRFGNRVDSYINPNHYEPGGQYINDSRFERPFGGHKFNEYIQYVHPEACGSGKPFFDGDMSNPLIPRLIADHWNAPKRYYTMSDFVSTGIRITTKDIKEILDFCTKYIKPYIGF